MRREEKRRKFNEAVINTLYPPPSPPSPPPKHEDVPLNILREDFELHELGERESGSSGTSGDEDEKLTRARRKRLRKKKLKEDACRRKQVIGPLLPLTIDEGENGPPGVRRNASEEPGDQQPPQPGCSNQKNKVKQRRKAKKVAREREQH